MDSHQRPSSYPPEKLVYRVERPGIGRLAWFLLGAAVLVSLLAVGIVPRMNRQAQLNTTVTQTKTGVPSVNVITPYRAKATTDLVLPGSIKASQETTIYAQTTGYVKRRLVDIGDRVAADQLLAEIESPEIDQQAEQAKADLAKTQANVGQARADLAKLEANVAQKRADLEKARTDLVQAQADLAVANQSWQRWQLLVQQGVVNQQQADAKQGAYKVSLAKVEAAQNTVNSIQADIEAAQANVNSGQANIDATVANVSSSQANLKRNEVLQSFKKVTAPFAGIITARSLDSGALITSNSTSNNTSLFKIAPTDSLRIYVNVPQTFVKSIQVGETAQIKIRDLPQRVFTGKVTRTADALDASTNTLQAEIQVPNGDKVLRPGMYAQVQFTATRANPPLMVPSNTVIMRSDGPQVAIATKDQKVHFQKVEIGRNYGTEVEITSGLQGNESLITNPTDNLSEGKTVKAVGAKQQKLF
ncbi:MAG TPA: efflux RND transporter periplasmic adaptor subunit [Oculatellaceae cyanobacterium]